MKKLFTDTLAMCSRSLRTSFRSPEALATATIVPVVLMLLFGVVFVNIMDFGEYSVINFILPGIVLQTLGQGASSTAIGVNNDMTRGIIDRFRSMPISKSAVLTGHVFAAVVRNIFTTAVILGVAMAIGFRPQANFSSWLIIAGILLLYMFAITWIAVIGGLSGENAESSANKIFLLFVLPYLSTGFVPADSVSGPLRWFVTHQPMTPIIDSLRGLMLGTTVSSGTMMLAFVWSVGAIFLAFIVALQMYKRKTS
jgi:ABC-2 type transport system permease protein